MSSTCQRTRFFLSIFTQLLRLEHFCFLLIFSFFLFIFIFSDGFHTSASDPALQKKYGHTKNKIDIAPPPIFNTVNNNNFNNNNNNNNNGSNFNNNSNMISTQPPPPPQYGMYAQRPYVQQDYNINVPQAYNNNQYSNENKHE